LKNGEIERNKQESDHNNKQITTATTSADEEEGVASMVWGRWSGWQNNRDKHGCQFHRLFINT